MRLSSVPNMNYSRRYNLLDTIMFWRNILKKGSIGRFVMKTLKIKSSRRQIFWNTYSHHVQRGIKSQRNVVHTNLRRKFMGKIISFILFDAPHTHIALLNIILMFYLL